MSSLKTFETIPDRASLRQEAIHAHEIGKDGWAEFCRWMTANVSGVLTNIIRDEGSSGPTVECIDRELKSIDYVLLPNGVSAINVTVAVHGKPHVFEIPGPEWLRVHYDAAGFVMRVEIGYQEGKLLLSFTGALPPGAVFTANSWGE